VEALHQALLRLAREEVGKRLLSLGEEGDGLCLIWGLGEGFFGLARPLLDARAAELRLGDLNGDGALDIAAISTPAEGALLISLSAT
jgi:hypothetical protein